MTETKLIHFQHPSEPYRNSRLTEEERNDYEDAYLRLLLNLIPQLPTWVGERIQFYFFPVTRIIFRTDTQYAKWREERAQFLIYLNNFLLPYKIK